MPGKLDIASLLKKSVQNIEQTASDKSSAPIPTPGPSKEQKSKKVSERKPKIAKKPAADKKAAAPGKKVGVKEKSREKKSKLIKEKKEKKEDTPFEEKVWQLDQVSNIHATSFVQCSQSMFAVQESDIEEVSWPGLGGCEGVLHGQIIARDCARYFNMNYHQGKDIILSLCLGKKGISLTMDQLKHLKSLFPELDNKFPSFSSSDKHFYDPLA